MSEKQKYWLCYLSQNGGKVSVNVADETARLIQSLIDRGTPFGLWFSLDSGRITGLNVNPMQGGLTLSLEKAQAIGIDANGQPAQNQASVARWIQPEDQAIGKVRVPAWGQLMSANMEAEYKRSGYDPANNGTGNHVRVDDEEEQPQEPPPGPPGDS